MINRSGSSSDACAPVTWPLRVAYSEAGECYPACPAPTSHAPAIAGAERWTPAAVRAGAGNRFARHLGHSIPSPLRIAILYPLNKPARYQSEATDPLISALTPGSREVRHFGAQILNVRVFIRTRAIAIRTRAIIRLASHISSP